MTFFCAPLAVLGCFFRVEGIKIESVQIVLRFLLHEPDNGERPSFVTVDFHIRVPVRVKLHVRNSHLPFQLTGNLSIVRRREAHAVTARFYVEREGDRCPSRTLKGIFTGFVPPAPTPSGLENALTWTSSLSVSRTSSASNVSRSTP